MPQPHCLLIAHLVFSTKDRQPFFNADIGPRLHTYLANVARNADCEAYGVGGVADHVHLAVRCSPTLNISDLVDDLKLSSAKWLRSQSSKLAGFAWQRGYGAFSVGLSELEELRKYIEGQEEHHRSQSFQEEYQGLLSKAGIEYEERYMWD